MNIVKEFKQFLLRGNVVDLAVAVVIGIAFGALVTALVGDLITPLIAAIGGKHDFSALIFSLNGSAFKYGQLINALISFLIILAVLFFFIVKPINWLIAKSRKQPDPNTRKCPECLSEIPKDARRCAHCTAQVSPVTAK